MCAGAELCTKRHLHACCHEQGCHHQVLQNLVNPFIDLTPQIIRLQSPDLDVQIKSKIYFFLKGNFRPLTVLLRVSRLSYVSNFSY